MAHDHSHGDRNAYYLNQLFTIAVCGALGGVAIMLWWNGTIRLLLHPKFFLWTLLGGITLLVLVVLRAIAVWRSVDELAAVPDHTHDHDHCDHDHDHCHHHHDHDHEHGHDPSHDHDHEHGWAPWRYVVLLLPVVLYFLNLPNQGFSADAGGSDLSDLSLSGQAFVSSRGQVSVGFVELQQASLTPESREYYEGKTVTLTGQYSGHDPRRFTLVRYKIACCAADAVRLNAVIMVNDKSSEKVDPDKYRNVWVQVTGRIRFFQKPGSDEFITGLILYPTEDEPISKVVKVITAPSTPWVN
jgi:hypothetical protein